MANRLAHIDGLRGLAAVLVLYQHLVEHCVAVAPQSVLLSAHLTWLFTYLDLGKVGVIAFFAISGFIVPSSYKGSHPRLGFVLSRLFRLYPAFWLSVLLAALVFPLALGQAVTWPQLLGNLTMVPALLKQGDLLGVYWTLRVEWLFYLLCLVVFTLGLMRRARAVLVLALAFGALGVVGGVLRGQGVSQAPVALPLYLAIMMLGHLMRLALLEADPAAGRWWPACLVAVFLASCVAWSAGYDDHTHKETVLADLSAFALGLALFCFCAVRRSFAARPLVYLGSTSYGIYLFHPIALAAAVSTWPAAAGGGDTLAGRVVLALLLTLLMAHLALRWVETPAIHLGRRLGTWLTARQPLEQAA